MERVSDRLISLKIVKDIDEAIEHINKYNTGHSETIVTENYDNAMRFWMKWMRHAYMLTRQPGLLMEASSVLALRLA